METNDKQKPEANQHFLDYWRIIRIRKVVILAVFVLVVFTTTAVTLLLPKSYMSSVRIAVTKNVADVQTIGYSPVSGAYDPYFMTTEFEKLRSRKVLYKVIEELKLSQKYGERFNEGEPLTIQEAYEVLKAQIDVSQPRNTSLIEISVFSDAKEGAPEEAKTIAQKIAEVYKDSRLELTKERAKKGVEALREELRKQDDKVKDAQGKVDELKSRYQITDAFVEGVQSSQLEAETVRRIEGQRIEAQASYEQEQKLLEQLEEVGAEGKEQLRNTINNAQYDQGLGSLLNDLWATEAKLASLKETLGPQHADYRGVAAMQADLDKKIDQKVRGIMDGLRVRVATRKAQVDSLAAAVTAAKQREAGTSAHYREYTLAKRDLENEQKIRDAIYLRALSETVDMSIPMDSIVEITDQAEVGLKPVRPNVKLNIALGVIVGLVVGIGLAFFIEYLDTSVKTIDDVERALDAAVLGVIPQNVGYLFEEGPDSPHAEAYRVLRTNVLFSRKNKDARTMTIVSGGAGEGKSTTICNLASVFAQNEQRVLLVDSDLRRPSLHKVLKVSNSVGLTNYLLGQKPLEEVIQTTAIPSLDFMPSGKLPSSSLGILNSPQMRDFINEIKERYDFVFFDSPPIMGISDASVLASMVDLTLLVVQYRKYPQMMTQRAKQMVEKVGGNLLGVVLNNINISQDSYYYYYSGYYYDYYSKHEDQEPAVGKNGGTKPETRASGSSRAASEQVKQKY